MKSPEPYSVADIVRRRLQGEGAAGEAWLAGLDAAVAGLAEAWSLTLGAVLAGGSASLVIAATTQEGRPAVLKLVTPGSESASAEPEVLAAAAGRGYAELLAYDPLRRAMLLERLGPPLAESGLSTEGQVEGICAALQAAWRVSPSGLPLTDGASKARDLADFIQVKSEALGRPCPRAAEVALEYARRRAAAFDPAAAVLGHGDPHEHNTLAAPGGGWKFVDPDGLFIEPAYDLGVVLRGWNEGVLAKPSRARARAERLASLAGVDAQPIWEWGFIERVSTGLLLAELGSDDEAREYLTVSELLAETLNPDRR
jgi:streptomycin 6-kinase